MIEVGTRGIGAQRPVVGHHVAEGHHGIEHGDVHVLAVAVTFPLAHSHEHPDNGVQARSGVAQRAHRGHLHILAIGPVDGVKTAHGLGDGGIGRPVAVRRLAQVSKTRHRQVDEAGMQLSQVVIGPTPSWPACRGLRFSASTSKLVTIWRMRSMAVEFFKSIPTERLLRLFRR